jgi:hypothetical protein
MKRAIKATMPKRVNKRQLVTVPIFRRIIKGCSAYGKSRHGLRCAFTLAYMGLLRKSNIAPNSQGDFDPDKHTTLQDIAIKHEKLVVSLKWTKTRQKEDPTFVVLPQVTDSPLNPVKHFRKMQGFRKQTAASQPLIIDCSGNPIFAAGLNKSLASIANKDNKIPPGITMHAFRRSGCTLMFNNGASALALAKHGTWKSEVYLQYILENPDAPSPVQSAMDQMLA